MPGPQTSVLFICLGNICRSPLAEGIFRHVVDQAGLAGQFRIDSAALGSWHVGNPPDRRAVDVAAQFDVDISRQRCRQISRDDFDGFDLVIGMDHANIDELQAIKPVGSSATIELMLEYSLGRDGVVPDPYYGDSAGFETTFHLLNEASSGLLERLSR